MKIMEFHWFAMKIQSNPWICIDFQWNIQWEPLIIIDCQRKSNENHSFSLVVIDLSMERMDFHWTWHHKETLLYVTFRVIRSVSTSFPAYYQWKSLNIMDLHWFWMKINENHGFPLIFNEKPMTSMNFHCLSFVNENQWKSRDFIDFQWKQWKSWIFINFEWKINEDHEFSLNCNEASM